MKRRVNNKILLNQSKPYSGKDTCAPYPDLLVDMLEGVMARVCKLLIIIYLYIIVIIYKYIFL